MVDGTTPGDRAFALVMLVVSVCRFIDLEASRIEPDDPFPCQELRGVAWSLLAALGGLLALVGSALYVMGVTSR